MHALFCHLVHVRRFSKLMPHEAHRIVTVIIGQDEHDVARFGTLNFDRADISGNRRYGRRFFWLISCRGFNWK